MGCVNNKKSFLWGWTRYGKHVRDRVYGLGYKGNNLFEICFECLCGVRMVSVVSADFISTLDKGKELLALGYTEKGSFVRWTEISKLFDSTVEEEN